MPTWPEDGQKGLRDGENRGFVSREALRVTASMTGDVKNEGVDAAVERDLMRNGALEALFAKYHYQAPPMREPWA